MGRRCWCGSVMWVDDDDDGDEDSGFGVWVMKVLGLEVGVGEGVEAVGLSGFVVEVVVVGLPIWCWWAMGCRSRFWVDGIVGRGWLRQRCGFWSDSYLSLFVDGLGFWVGDWLRQLIGGEGFGWGLAGFVWVVKDLAGI